MSKPALFLLCALLSASCATVKGQNYAKTIFYGDVELRGTPGVSNFTATLTSGSLVGTYYYRLSGTNLAGRIPSTSATNLTCATNGVLLQWKRRDGLFAYVVERSRDGSTWTNWCTVRPDATSFTDKGTSTWAGTVFTSVYAAVASPTAIGFPFLSTSSPDGVTVIYSNGILSAIAPAGPDAVARADIADHKTNATAHAAMGWVTSTITNGLASTNWVVGRGYLTAEFDTNALAQLATETNRAIQAEAALYPRSNPSNYVDRAGATQGMQVAGAYLTNEAAWLAVSNSVVYTNTPAYTATVAKAASALQSEADTLATVATRGRTITDGANNNSDAIVFGPNPNLPLLLSLGLEMKTTYFWRRLCLHSDNDTLADFYKEDVNSMGGPWKIYDSQNFVAGTNYVSPTDARYLAAITQLTASAISAAGGVTGTVVRVEADPVWAAASNLYLMTNGSISGVTGTLPAGVLGTNVVRTIGGLITTGSVSAGSVTINGAAAVTGTPWTALGYLTNDSYTAGTDLSSALVGTTCTITRAHGQSCYLVLTTNTTFTVDSSYPTNGAGTFELSTQLGGFSATFLAGTMTNTQASLSTGTTWNATIFHRGYRQTLWTGR